MKVLAIETSGSIGSVATWEEGKTVVEVPFERGMEHGRALVPMLQEALASCGWRLLEVGLIAVSQGPGSYTGLRVGLTCAKTLAVFQKTPLVGVPSLDVMALNAPTGYSTICPVMDAKRGQVYTAMYQGDDPPPRRSDLMVLHPDDVVRRLVMPAFIFGDGIRRHRAEFVANGVTLGDEDTWRAHAGSVARLGAAVFAERGADDPLQLEPIYLRRPEAEEKWEARIRSREQGVG